MAAKDTDGVLQAIQSQLGTLDSEPLVRLRRQVLDVPCRAELVSSVQVPPVRPLVTVISGPSGVGKDAVVKALQAARPELHFVVTATSRCTAHI